MSRLSENIRFLVIILSVMCVIAGSLLSLLLAYRIGVPDFSYILLIICLVINLVQLSFYIVAAIKSLRGDYVQNIKYGMLAANLLWVVMTIVHFSVASAQSFLRYDLLVIALCQTITLILIYTWWNKVDYKITCKYYATMGTPEGSSTKIESMKNRSFFAFLIVIVVLQVCVVALPYIITSTLYNNQNLKYRTLSYVKSENGKEYYVDGVYWGQSNTVFIPSEHNGLKVTGISENAINADTLKNKLFNKVNAIDEIIFEDTDKNPCNIETICSGAIVSDKITELTIPQSVTQLQTKAIVAENLTDITCEAQAGEVYFGGSILAPKLVNLLINASSDMKIDFTDDFDTSSLKVKIVNDNDDPNKTDKLQEKYNYIRKNYPDLKKNLDVTSTGDKILVNFETGLDDIYIDSKMLSLTSGVVPLSSTLFGNLQNATEKYIVENDYLVQDSAYIFHPIGMNEGAHGYVLRGWENSEGMLLNFSELSFSTTLTKSTSLTAKWSAVYKIDYDWGSFFVPDGADALPQYFIRSEEKNNFDLPKFSDYNRVGYTDLNWYCMDSEDSYYGDTSYTSTKQFNHSVKLTPIWAMEVPTLSRKVFIEDQLGTKEYNKTALSYEYDEESAFFAKYTLSHSIKKEGISYLINWRYAPGENQVLGGIQPQQGSFMLAYDKTNSEHSIIDSINNNFASFEAEYDEINSVFVVTLKVNTVPNSGTYFLSAKAYSANKDREESVDAMALSEVSINIDKKVLDLNSYAITFPPQEFVYDGSRKNIIAYAGLSPECIRFEYQGNGETEVANDPYLVSATIVKMVRNPFGDNEDAYIDDVNYATGVIRSTYKINKFRVSLKWRLDDKVDYGIAFTQEYDGRVHKLKAEYAENTPGAITEAGEIKLIESTGFSSTGKNIGIYTARVASLNEEDNNNYTYQIDENSSDICTLTIVPRPVKLSWNSDSEFVYSKTEKVLTANITNLIVGDNCILTYTGNNKVDVPVGHYTATVTELSNDNYTLVGCTNTSIDWSIRQKPITVEWVSDSKSTVDLNKALHITYNASIQNVYARVTNACEGDELAFTYEGNITSDIGSDTVNNFATKVGSYVVRITSLTGAPAANYTIDELKENPLDCQKSCNWVIDKVKLSKVWDVPTSLNYDGARKDATLTIKGFAGDDVENILLSDFILNSNDMEHSGSFKANAKSEYVIVFSAYDAGQYGFNCTDISSDSYSLNSSINQEMTINKKQLAVQWYSDPSLNDLYKETGYTYNALEQKVYPKLIGAVVHQKTNVLDEIVPTVGGDYAIDANDYTADISAISNNNYFVDSNAKSLIWIINPAPLTLSFSNTASFVYDGLPHGVTVSLSGFMGTDHTHLAEMENLDANFTYTNLTPEAISTARNVRVENDVLSVDFIGVNASSYSFSLTGFADKNYIVSNIPVGFVINPAPLALSFSDINSFVYDGEPHGVTVSVSGFMGTDQMALSETELLDANFTYTNSTPENIKTARKISTTEGVLSVEFQGVDASAYNFSLKNYVNTNYTVSVIPISFTIAPRQVAVTWSQNSGHEFIYSSAEHNVTADVSNKVSNKWLLDGATTDTVNLLFSGDTNTNASDTYTTTIIGTDNVNYSITELPEAEGFKILSWSIAKRTISAHWEGAVEQIYNRDKRNITLTLSNLPAKDRNLLTKSSFEVMKNGIDTIDFDYINVANAEVIQFVFSGVNVGDYLYSVSLVYNNFNNFSAEKTLTVIPKSLEVSWNTREYIYDGTEHHIIATPTNVCSGDFPVITYTHAENAKDVGNYVTSIASVEDANYTIATLSESAKNCSWIIKPLPISVSWQNTSFVYDATEHNTRVIINNIMGSDSVSVTYTTTEGYSVAQTNAGNYTARIATIDNNNYTLIGLSGGLECGWKILPRPLSFIWKTGGTAALHEYTYDGENVELIPQVSNGIVNNDIITLSMINNTGKDSNRQIAEVTDCGNPNYSAEENKQFEWIIKPRSLVVEWNIDELTYNATEQTITATIKNVVSKDLDAMLDKITCDNSSAISKDASNLILAVKNVDAGDYTIIINNSNANYSLPAERTTNYTINRKQISVNWGSNDGYVYNGQEYTAVYFLTGVCVRNGVTDKVEVSISENKKTKAGSYTAIIKSDLTPGNNSNSNYVLAPTNLTKDWMISKKTLEPTAFSWSESTGTEYDKANHTVSLRINGILLADSYINKDSVKGVGIEALSKIEREGEIQVFNFSYKAARTYEIEVSAFNDNYTFTKTSKIYTISPRPITIVWSGNGGVYNNSAYSMVAVADGIDETVGFVYSTDSTLSATNAGNYTAKVIGITNTNYTIKDLTDGNKTVTWTITKRNLTANWSDESFLSFTYNKTPQGKTLEISGFLVTPANTNINISGNGLAPSVLVMDKKLVVTYKATAHSNDVYTMKTVTLAAITAENYTLSVPAAQGFMINRKQLTGTWTKDASYSYDGTAKNITYTINGLEDGDSFYMPNGTVTGNGTQNANVLTYNIKNAGEYELGITECSNGNYSISGDITKVYVSKKVLNVEYTAAENSVYSGNTVCSVKIKGYVASDLTALQLGSFITGITATNGSGGTVSLQKESDRAILNYVLKDSATYTLQYSYSSNNYMLSSGTEHFTITKKPINVVWNNNGDVTYDGAMHRPYVTSPDIIDSGVSFSYNDGVAKKDAGEYEITVNGIIGSDNYKIIEENLSCNWKINPKVVTITWSDNRSSKEYNGTEQTVTATITNKVGADAPNLIITNNKKINAGSFEANITGIDNTNYTLVGAENVKKSWIIQPKKVSISWNNTSKVYNNTLQTQTATVTNKVGSDTVTLTISGNKEINAGRYKASAVGVDNTNYTVVGVSNLTYDWSIAPQEVSFVGWQWQENGAVAWNSIVDLDLTYSGKRYNFMMITNNDNALKLQYSIDNVATDEEYPSISEGVHNISVIGVKDNNNYVVNAEHVDSLPVTIKDFVLDICFLLGDTEVEHGGKIAYNGISRSLKLKVKNESSLTSEGQTKLNNSWNKKLFNPYSSDTVTDKGTYERDVTLIDNSPFLLTVGSGTAKTAKIRFAIQSINLTSDFASGVAYDSLEECKNAIKASIKTILAVDSFENVINVKYYTNAICTSSITESAIQTGEYWFTLSSKNNNYSLNSVNTVYSFSINNEGQSE